MSICTQFCDDVKLLNDDVIKRLNIDGSLGIKGMSKLISNPLIHNIPDVANITNGDIIETALSDQDAGMKIVHEHQCNIIVFIDTNQNIDDLEQCISEYREDINLVCQDEFLTKYSKFRTFAIESYSTLRLKPNYSIANFVNMNTDGIGSVPDIASHFKSTKMNFVCTTKALIDKNFAQLGAHKRVDCKLSVGISEHTNRYIPVWFDGKIVMMNSDDLDDMCVQSSKFFWNGQLVFTSANCAHEWKLRRVFNDKQLEIIFEREIDILSKHNNIVLIKTQ